MSASGRYLEYIQVNSQNVIVEVRVLESKVQICGKRITTNKWLLPRQWQEVYSILHTAGEYYMNNKDKRTLVASGKDIQVALMFEPYLIAYEYVIKPYSINGSVEEALEDSGNIWMKSKPYEIMIIASVAPNHNSDVWSTVDSESSSDSCQNAWYGPTGKISCGITWKTLDNVEVQMSSHKLEDGYLRSTEHASVIQDTESNHPFDLCYSQDMNEVKYSRYTGEPSWVTADTGNAVTSSKDVDHKHNFKHKSSPSGSVSSSASSSRESFELRRKKRRKLSKKHNAGKNKASCFIVDTGGSVFSSKDVGHKHNFKSESSPSGNVSNNASSPRESLELRAKKVGKLSKKHNVVKNKASDSPKSKKNGQTKSIFGTSGTFITKEHKQRNTQENINRFSSPLEKKKAKTRSKVETDLGSHSRGDRSITKRKASGMENSSETVSEKWNLRRNKETKTDKIMSSFSLNSERKVKKSTTCQTISLKRDKSSKDFKLETKKRKLQRKVCSKNEYGNGPTITQFFEKISPSCSAQTNVKTLKESISELSNSDDECVPDTPPQEPNFHIMQTIEKKKCLMNLRSTDNNLIVQKSSSSSKIVNLNCDKCCNKTVSFSEERRQTKKKRSRLSRRKKGSEPVRDMNKDKSSTDVPECFGSAQTKESTIFKNLIIPKGSVCVTTSASVKLQSENQKFERSVSNTSLLQFKKNECSTDASASKRKKVKNSTLPNTSFCNRNSESPLKSKKMKTSQVEEGSTSSNSAIQDITAIHLTLGELEERFHKNVEYLRAIMNGKEYCERQIQFKKQGVVSMNLRYAVSTVPYTDDQLHYLLSLLRKNFCKENNFVKLYDYLMKVLLPEATTKILMDEFSLAHSEVLEKLHNTYIVGRKQMPFAVSDYDDD